MTLGAMRERLALQSPTRTADSQGGAAVTWATVDTVWASLVSARAQAEQLRSEAVTAGVDYTFRVRVRADVDPTYRALWRPSWSTASTPKTLEIHAVEVDPDEPMAYERLVCGEIQ